MQSRMCEEGEAAESSESEGDVEHTRDEREFLLFRQKVKQHNKDRLKARQETGGPFKVNSQSLYGAMELTFANNKSVSRRIWRKKNINLAARESQSEAGFPQPDLQDGGATQDGGAIQDGGDAQAPQSTTAPSTYFEAIWNISWDFFQSIYSVFLEIITGVWDYVPHDGGDS